MKKSVILCLVLIFFAFKCYGENKSSKKTLPREMFGITLGMELKQFIEKFPSKEITEEVFPSEEQQRQQRKQLNDDLDRIDPTIREGRPDIPISSYPNQRAFKLLDASNVDMVYFYNNKVVSIKIKYVKSSEFFLIQSFRNLYIRPQIIPIFSFCNILPSYSI